MNIEILYKIALQAIRDLYNNTSIPKKEVLAKLEDLANEIDSFIETLYEETEQ